MKKKLKLLYLQPAMDVVELKACISLLSGTPVDSGSGGIDPWNLGENGSGEVNA